MQYTLDLAKVHSSPGKCCPALALSAKGDRQGYYGVKLLGYQDTLYTNTGTQFFANSYIEGVWYVSFLPQLDSSFFFSYYEVR